MAYHTFEFLRRRRKDPKWRDAYLNALLKRILGAISFLLIVIVMYVRDNNIDVMAYLESLIKKVEYFFN